MKITATAIEYNSYLPCNIFQSHLSCQILHAQEESLRKLHEEDKALRASITKVRGDAAAQMLKPISLNVQSEVEKYHKNLRHYASKASVEQEKIKTTAKENKDLERKIKAKREASGGVNADQEKRLAKEKQEKILEDKVEQTWLKYNQLVTTNKKLKREIDDLKREERAFRGRLEKLDQDISNTKQKYAEALEMFNAMHSKGEKATKDRLEIEERNRIEEAKFEEEMVDFRLKLNTDLEIKIPCTEVAPATENGEVDNLHDNSNGNIEKDLPTGQEDDQLTFRTAKHVEDQTQMVQERIAMYQDVLKQLSDSIGTNNLDEAATIYIAQEQTAASLENQIRRQSDEIEGLEEAIETLRQQAQQLAKRRREEQKKEEGKLKRLHLEQKASELELSELQKNLHSKNEDMHELIDCMSELFAKVDCRLNESGSQDVFDTIEDLAITEANIVDYFRVLERHIHSFVLSS
jgi:DNA repair exonuclease SbcCD ATPase subunit